MLNNLWACPKCLSPFNVNHHIPWIIETCSHIICSTCAENIFLQKSHFICPFEHEYGEAPQYPNLRSLKPHPILGNVENRPRKFHHCLDHNVPLKWMCFDHESKICDRCKATSHRACHEVRLSDSVRIEAEVKRKGLEKSLDEFNKIYETLNSRLVTDKKNLRRLVRKKFEEFFELLKRKEEETLIDIEVLFEVQKSEIEALLSRDAQVKKDVLNEMADLDAKNMADSRFFKTLKSKLPVFGVKYGRDKQETEVRALRNKFEYTFEALEDFTQSLLGTGKEEAPKKMVKVEENAVALKKVIKVEEEAATIIIDEEENHFLSETNDESHNETSQDLPPTPQSENHNVYDRLQDLMIGFRSYKSLPPLPAQGVRTFVQEKSCLENAFNLNVCFDNKAFIQEKHLSSCLVHLQESKDIQGLNLGFSDSKLEDVEVLDMFDMILPKMENLKSLSVDLSGTFITSKILKVLPEKIFPSLRGEIEKLRLDLSQTRTNDHGLEALLVQIQDFVKGLKSFELSLYGTKLEGKGLEALQMILESMPDLQALDLDLSSNNLNDNNVAFFCLAISKSLKNITRLSLKLKHNVNLTDKSIEVLAKKTLPELSALKELELHLGGTGVTDVSIEPLGVNLKKMAQKMKVLILDFDHTYVSDKSVSRLINYGYFPLGTLYKLEISLEMTKVSDDVKRLIRSIQDKLI